MPKLFEKYQWDSVTGFKMGTHPFTKPKLCVYNYFIDGLLIDTGHSHCRREILDATHKLSINQLVITHHHEDHCGNADHIRKQQHCPILATRRCIDLIKKPSTFRPAQYAIWGKSEAVYDVSPIEKQVVTNNYKFDIIDLPGHAEDMIGLYEPNHGWFFSADLWVSNRIKYFIHNESMLDQINSLKRAEELDISILFCSHNPQTKQIRRQLVRKRQFFEDFYSTVVKYYQKGQSSRAILKSMGLQEQLLIKYLSWGTLSTQHMIRAAIRDYEQDA